MFIIAQDGHQGKAVSDSLTLPANIDHVQYLHGGGAGDGTSGFWVKRVSDDSILCFSQNGQDSDTLFEQQCTGLSSYDGTVVYFEAACTQVGGWSKIMIDNIRLQDSSNNDLDYCFGGEVTGRIIILMLVYKIIMTIKQ